jgi:subtilisin family serine protease
MATALTLKFAGTDVELTRNDELVAVSPLPGLSRAFETELMSREVRRTATRRGKVGAYELLELPDNPATQRAARGDLDKMTTRARQRSVYHTSGDGVPFVPSGTIYMGFAPGATSEDINGVLQRYALVAVRSEAGGFTTVATEADPVQVCAELQREPAVAVAEPDLITPRTTCQLPDGLFDRHWHLNNLGRHGGQTFGFKAGADARVVEAWHNLGGLGSDAAVIGIIDDGFDFNHPDLQGKEILPWDVTRNSPDVSPADPLTGALNWHGTACAGVAAGRAGAGDIVGAAPNARIMPVRIGTDLHTEELARAFGYLAANGAWVVNCSWGPAASRYPLGLRVANAISECVRSGRRGKGAAVLFAAGNSNVSINDPTHLNGFATHPDVIAVASSTSLDQRSDTSNFGRDIWVCAPSSGGGGWAIVTSDVTGDWVEPSGVSRPRGYGPGDYFTQFGGTSSSCALVAGVCALILSAAPGLSAVDLRTVLKQTARRIGDPASYDAAGHSEQFGYGCINAAAAIAAVSAGLTG